MAFTLSLLSKSLYHNAIFNDLMEEEKKRMDAHNLFTASHHQSNEKWHWFIPGLAVANISNPLLLLYQSALILEVQYQLQQLDFCNISLKSFKEIVMHKSAGNMLR